MRLSLIVLIIMRQQSYLDDQFFRYIVLNTRTGTFWLYSNY